jgi:hypothetical protein
MNEDAKAAVLSAVRSTLIALGAYAVGKGWIGQGVIDQLVPAVLVIVTAAWGAVNGYTKPK